jgi:hypothetical protein
LVSGRVRGRFLESPREQEEGKPRTAIAAPIGNGTPMCSSVPAKSAARLRNKGLDAGERYACRLRPLLWIVAKKIGDERSSSMGTSGRAFRTEMVGFRRSC